MYATPDEVSMALGALTNADYYRLFSIAKVVMRGSGYQQSADLVSDAFSTSLLAAHGQGGRRWKTEVPFMAYLVMTIRGIASDAQRDAYNRVFKGGYFSPEDPDPEIVTSDPWSPSAQSPDEQESERQKKEEEDLAILEQVRQYFEDDAQVKWVIKGIEEGMPKRVVCKLSGMSEKDYEAALKRWNRHLNKVVPQRRKV